MTPMKERLRFPYHPFLLLTFDIPQESFEDVKMGETDAAMEYDREHIFKHL